MRKNKTAQSYGMITKKKEELTQDTDVFNENIKYNEQRSLQSGAPIII